ncbi:MAG: hypothetical protein LBR59_00265 [Endomicrobium sp.]|nr:hypothetical protein [Endomicrobium sp.]
MKINGGESKPGAFMGAASPYGVKGICKTRALVLCRGNSSSMVSEKQS